MRKKSPPPAAGFSMMARDLRSGDPLSDAMSSAVSAYSQTLDHLDRIGNDTTLTVGGRLVRQASVARSKMQPALKAVTDAIARKREGLAATDAALDEQVSFGKANLAEISLAAELRQHFRANPSAVQAAVDGMDLQSLKAISAAPAVLTGLSDQVHQHVREKFLSVMAPEALARRKQLDGDIRFAQNFADQMQRAFLDSVDFDSADAIAKGAAE